MYTWVCDQCVGTCWPLRYDSTSVLPYVLAGARHDRVARRSCRNWSTCTDEYRFITALLSRRRPGRRRVKVAPHCDVIGSDRRRICRVTGCPTLFRLTAIVPGQSHIYDCQLDSAWIARWRFEPVPEILLFLLKTSLRICTPEFDSQKTQQDFLATVWV